jgi:hypothetical protein
MFSVNKFTIRTYNIKADNHLYIFHYSPKNIRWKKRTLKTYINNIFQGGNSGLQDFKTSKDFTRLQQLGLQIFKRFRKTSKDFMRLHETAWDFMRLQGTSRDFTRLQVTSWDFMRLQLTSCDFMRLHETSWDCMRLHETSRDFKRLH